MLNPPILTYSLAHLLALCCIKLDYEDYDEDRRGATRQDDAQMLDDQVYRDFDEIYKTLSYPNNLQSGNSRVQVSPQQPYQRQEANLRAYLTLGLPQEPPFRGLQSDQVSPSVAGSEAAGRADSRDTYLSLQNGPALVEEMTLTDLEDEIGSSLVVTSNYRSRPRPVTSLEYNYAHHNDQFYHHQRPDLRHHHQNPRTLGYQQRNQYYDDGQNQYHESNLYQQQRQPQYFEPASSGNQLAARPGQFELPRTITTTTTAPRRPQTMTNDYQSSSLRLSRR